MDKKEKIILVSRLIAGTAIFAVLVAVLLLLNYYQMSKQDPVDSAAISALVERLSQESGNDALKLEIRQLDLLARKAYFTSVWQVRTGGFLLLFAGIVLGVLLKILYDLKARISMPESDNTDEEAGRRLASEWIWAVAGLVFISSLVAAYLTQDQLAHYGEYKLAQSEEAVSVIDDSEIEVIEIGDKELRDSETSEVQGSKEQETKGSLDPGKSEAAAKEYPAFRGYMSNGVSFQKDIPTDWDGASGTNILWKVPVPRSGFNSPIIWEDRLFLAGGDKELREVFCFNRNTGDLLWKKAVTDIEGSPAKPPKVTSDTGLSAPTLTTDGKRVYAIFGTGDLIAFDMKGNRVWARNMGVPDNHYGHSSSLVCHDNKLIVLYDTNKGGKIMALNVKDGKTIWNQKRENRISWSSPILAEIDKKMVIITTTDPYIAAHDLETGKQLWSVECLMGEVGPSAAYGSGLVYGTNEYARLVAIKPGAEPEIVWENDEYLPEVASPVVSDGLLFIGTSYGVFVCFDALSGEKYWEHEANQGYYASPIIADGKVYAIDMDGIMHIFAQDKELKIISEPKLGEKVVATPAFSTGRIYIRGVNNLYCIKQK